MHDLESILEKVRNGGRVIVDWPIVRNTMFRSENPIKEIKDWAEQNGIAVIISNREESLTHRIVENVTFLPKRKAK